MSGWKAGERVERRGERTSLKGRDVGRGVEDADAEGSEQTNCRKLNIN